jgi:hypothetical protein
MSEWYHGITSCTGTIIVDLLKALIKNGKDTSNVLTVEEDSNTRIRNSSKTGT